MAVNGNRVLEDMLVFLDLSAVTGKTVHGVDSFPVSVLIFNMQDLA